MNKHRLVFLFFALSAPLLWSGCSGGEVLYDDEPLAPDGDELVEIRLQSVASSLQPGTRAPFIGGIKTGNPLVARVLLSGESGKYLEGVASGYYKGSMTFDDQTSTKGFSTRQYYPADGSDIYLCGLYPDDDRWAGYVGDATTVGFAFDGKTDVMAAVQVATNKTEAKAGTYKELAFRHLLTNLIVLAQAEMETGVTLTDIQNAWGRITGFELVKALGSDPNDKVTVTLSSEVVSYSVATASVYAGKFYNASGVNYPVTDGADSFVFKDTPLTSAEGSVTTILATAQAVAYSMIAPIMATGTKDFKLLVKTEKRTEGVAVDVDLSTAENTTGKYCIVTLKFKNTAVLATASVKDWAVGSTAGVIIQ